MPFTFRGHINFILQVIVQLAWPAHGVLSPIRCYLAYYPETPRDQFENAFSWVKRLLKFSSYSNKLLKPSHHTHTHTASTHCLGSCMFASILSVTSQKNFMCI